jgi:hypothetical protein
MRGAPQVGFSATIRNIKSRTSLGIRFLPIAWRALEIARQYRANPVRCHRTTVSGLTTTRACFQPDQNLRSRTQKSLSDTASRGLGCLRFKTASCCRKTRFSSRRLRRLRNRRKNDARMTARRRNMARSYRKSLVQINRACC